MLEIRLILLFWYPKVKGSSSKSDSSEIFDSINECVIRLFSLFDMIFSEFLLLRSEFLELMLISCFSWILEIWCLCEESSSIVTVFANLLWRREFRSYAKDRAGFFPILLWIRESSSWIVSFICRTPSNFKFNFFRSRGVYITV